MRIELLLFLILALLLPTVAKSQEQISQNHPPLSPWTLNYWTNYATDFGGFITAPAHFDKSDAWTAAAIGATWGILFALDGDIQDLSQNNKSSTTHYISDGVEGLGRWPIVIPSLIGAYSLGYAIQDYHIQETALIALESLVLSGALVQIGKLTFHRYRPRESSSPYRFNGPSFSQKHMSLPSGDAAVAFSVASVVAHEYPENIFISVLSYGLAGLVALERIHENAHYASDVFLGAALGYFMGAYLVHQHSRYANLKISIQPILEKGSGVSVTYQY